MEVRNKSMKRILSIILAVLVVSSFAACGENAKAEEKGTETAAEKQNEAGEHGSEMPDPAAH